MQLPLQNRSVAMPPREADAAAIVLNAEIFGTLHELLDGAVLAETYREFLAQTRLRLASMPAASETVRIGETAHTMRGTAAMLGASAIARTVSRLEHTRVSVRDLQQIVEQLWLDCDELETALHDAKVEL